MNRFERLQKLTGFINGGKEIQFVKLQLDCVVTQEANPSERDSEIS